MSDAAAKPKPRLLAMFAVIGPGLLIAATGVGAGDLAGAGFAGSRLGMTVAWAVIVGAIFKFALNEGLARYQLATGQTLLEGAVDKLGMPVVYVFAGYLLLWSFFVGAALMTACGAAVTAMLPDTMREAATRPAWLWQPDFDMRAFAIIHSVVAVILVTRGGFKLFEKLMSICIVVMFVTVVVTAVLLRPDWAQLGRGLVWPTIPQFNGEGLNWTMVLIGGVGGTVTVLCYGYWIREAGRDGPQHLKTCRIDLAVAYTATALFGIAMLVISSSIDFESDRKGSGLIVELANRLQEPLGPAGRWVFLIGAWGALFSSLLGVWQAVPYLFADFARMVARRRSGRPAVRDGEKISTNSGMYRLYLMFLAIVPMAAVFNKTSFEQLQKLYGIIGALFIPMLAFALLLLNGRSIWVGRRMRNGWLAVTLLLTAMGFFAWFGYTKIAATINEWIGAANGG